MRRNEYVIFILGICLGILLTTFANASQPRHIELTLTKPLIAELDVKNWTMEGIE